MPLSASSRIVLTLCDQMLYPHLIGFILLQFINKTNDVIMYRISARVRAVTISRWLTLSRVGAEDWLLVCRGWNKAVSLQSSCRNPQKNSVRTRWIHTSLSSYSCSFAFFVSRHLSLHYSLSFYAPAKVWQHSFHIFFSSSYLWPHSPPSTHTHRHTHSLRVCLDKGGLFDSLMLWPRQNFSNQYAVETEANTAFVWLSNGHWLVKQGLPGWLKLLW